MQEEHFTTLGKLAKDFGHCEAVCFSRDPYIKKIKDILVLPWEHGI